MKVTLKHKPKNWNITYAKQKTPKKLLTLAITYYRHLTISRTRSGKDANLQSFLKYSDGYLKVRVKKGRSTKVNLSYSGTMLNSIAIVASNTHAKSYVRSHSKIGLYHNNGSGNLPIRLWWGFSTKILHDIHKIMSNNIQFTGK